MFLGETADLEFLDLIRKQLGCIQGGVAWGRTEPPGHGPTLQKKAWRGAGESDLAKTQNSTRQPLSGPEPKRHLSTCSEAIHVSGDSHVSSSSFRRQSRPHLYSKTKSTATHLRVFVCSQSRGPCVYHSVWQPSPLHGELICDLHELGQPACLNQSPPLFCSPSPAVIHETRDSTPFPYVPSSRPA